jgi:hypothetical protein
MKKKKSNLRWVEERYDFNTIFVTGEGILLELIGRADVFLF